MSIVVDNSLAETLDAIETARFGGLTLSREVRREASNWIAGRCGQRRSYAGMPAPTARDYRLGFRVFTGERIESGAAVGHVLGEEACRALRLLDIRTKRVQGALAESREGIHRHVMTNRSRPPGLFCCGSCTAALWRNITAGDFPDGAEFLSAGLKALKAHRDGKGRWKRFPFHYTLLALLDLIDAERPAVGTELRYTRRSCERSLKATRGKDVYALRRRGVMEKVLSSC